MENSRLGFDLMYQLISEKRSSTMVIRRTLITAFAAVALWVAASGTVCAEGGNTTLREMDEARASMEQTKVSPMPELEVRAEKVAYKVTSSSPKVTAPKADEAIRYMLICGKPHKVTSANGHVVAVCEIAEMPKVLATPAKKVVAEAPRYSAATSAVPQAEYAPPTAPAAKVENPDREIRNGDGTQRLVFHNEAGKFVWEQIPSPYIKAKNEDPDNVRANKAPTFEVLERTVAMRRPVETEVTIIPGRIHKSALKFKKGGGFNFGVAAYDRGQKDIFQGTGFVGQPDGDPETVPVDYVFQGRVPETAAVVASEHCEKYWSKELNFFNIRTGAPWKAAWGVASADPDHVERIAYRSAAGSLVRDIPGVKVLSQRQSDDWMRTRGFSHVSSQDVLYYVNPGVSTDDFADLRATSPDKYLYQRAIRRNGFPMIAFPISGPIGPLVSNAWTWVDAAIDSRNNFPAREETVSIELERAETEARAKGWPGPSPVTGTTYGKGTGGGATRTHLDSIFFYGRDKARLENYMGMVDSTIHINDGKTRVRSLCDFANIAYRPLSFTSENAGIWLGGNGIYSGWRSHATPWNSNDHGQNIGGGPSIKAVYMNEKGYGGEMIVEGGMIRKTQTCLPKNVSGEYAHLYGQVWFPGLKINDNVSLMDSVDVDFFTAPREMSLAARVRPLHVTAYRRDLVNIRLGGAVKRFPGIGNALGGVASVGILDDSIIPFAFISPGRLAEGGVSVSLGRLGGWINRACIFGSTYEVDWETHHRVH